ncbi:MAG: hypothetical protein WCK58_01690 [Chloroflexota bacterium]
MRASLPADPRARRIRLERGRAAVEIAPGVGGRIAALEVDGWDLVRRDGWTDNEWGVFVMAPWAGRLRDARVAWGDRTWEVPANEPPHALHGLVAATPWNVADQAARSVRLETPLGPDWPTGGWLVHTITLAPDRLIMRLDLHADREPTPAIMGWHPWFARRARRVAAAVDPDAGRYRAWRQDEAARPDHEAPAMPLAEQALADLPTTGEVSIGIAARRRLALDDAGLPTGILLEPRPEPLDDVLLGLTAAPVVSWPHGPRLTLHASGVAAWIAYTAHPDGVCVEPVTGIPDGINGGLLGEPPIASPRSPLSATFEIAWS